MANELLKLQREAQRRFKLVKSLNTMLDSSNANDKVLAGQAKRQMQDSQVGHKTGPNLYEFWNPDQKGYAR